MRRGALIAGTRVSVSEPWRQDVTIPASDLQAPMLLICASLGHPAFSIPPCSVDLSGELELGPLAALRLLWLDLAVRQHGMHQPCSDGLAFLFRQEK
jgi:hypothetical protein